MMLGAKVLAVVAVAAQLSAATTASGLKDALRVATEEAVATTSKSGGFLDNPKIRIPLPGNIESMANGLRVMGLGAKVDELEVAMNTAAEKAAGEATPVFSKALGDMTFKDASGILSGGDTAATQYFKRTTSADLTTRFRPIVDQAMAKVGVVQQYDALVSSYSSTPLGSVQKLDLGSYVTEHTLAGLFKVMGEEEMKIRKDPAARTTSLLKEVFGH